MALKDALPRAAANRETRLEALALEDCQVGELGAKVGTPPGPGKVGLPGPYEGSPFWGYVGGVDLAIMVRKTLDGYPKNDGYTLKKVRVRLKK